MKIPFKVSVTFLVSIIFLVLGILLSVFWTRIFDHFFTLEFTLTPKSTNYKMWKQTPVPIFLKLYMFNWTNPHDFNLTNGIKPNFVEMGPYVFRQVDYKVNLVWNNNATVTFQRRRIWHFDESLSNGKLSDEVTNVDPVAATVAYTLKDERPFFRDLVNKALMVLGHKVWVTKTVRELLFEGYNDTMLVIARKFNLSTIPYTKFGWFYARNESDTYDGTFNMLTGETSLRDTGMLKEWNYKSKSNYRGTCGVIQGSNGELWPPLPYNRTVSLFVSDICTNLNLQYNGSADYLGLTGSKFIADETMLDNGGRVPSRTCYCPKEGCLPTGMLDVSSCKYGAPAYVSLPHFYLADSRYRDNVTGMNPSEEKHETFILIEPTTGIPMQVRARLQLNLMVQPVANMSLFQNINKTYMPMLWFTQEVNLTSGYASKIKFLLIVPTLGTTTGYGIIGIGALLFFITAYLFIKYVGKDDEGQLLLSRNDNQERING